MNNFELSLILSSHIGTRDTFAGVYAKDTLPMVPRRKKPCAYVVNTAAIESGSGGDHWICLYIPKNGPGEYFDSYGQQPIPEFIRFMNCEHYIYQTRVIQSPIATTCGQFCIYYIYNRAVSLKTMHDIISNLLTIDRRDEYVNSMVERTFLVNLDVVDINFVVRRLAREMKR